MARQIITIDMDSTICHNESDGKFGKPLEEAKEAIAE